MASDNRWPDRPPGDEAGRIKGDEMKFFRDGSEAGAGKYTGPVVSECWVTLDSRGLWVQWSRGDGFVDSARLDDSAVVGGMYDASIDEIDDDAGEVPPELAAIFENFSCEPGRRYEWFDAIIKAESVPPCDLSDECGPFVSHKFRCRENMLHDPNFHASMEGASRREKEEVASDLCGVPDAGDD